MKLASLFVLFLLEFTKQGKGLVVRPYNSYATKIWKIRLQAAISLMRSHPCINSQTSHNCNRTLLIPLRDMNVYIASKSHPNERLRARLPDRKHRSLIPNDRNIDGVIVIDPYPEANFGHLVYIFFVEENRNHQNCTRNLTATFTGTGDCVIAATKSHCKNAVSLRKRKKCYVDFLPLVFTAGDSTKTQKLSCQDRLFGFGKCRPISASSPAHQHCANSPSRCLNPTRAPQKMCISKRCDYGVLVSGGWAPLTAHARHKINLQNFWRFLRDNKFKKEHIVTFYGSDGNIELDGDPKTQDAVPAVTDVGVIDYVSKLCRARWCVDTLVLYLTGPARSNGALLMWDINGDGLTENKEMYAVHEIFKHLSSCNAKRVFIVADYSYSGHLVNRLRELRRHRHRDAFKHVTVLASSESNQYSWRNEFTDTLIKYGRQKRTRSIQQLFKDIKQDFNVRGIHSTPTLAQGSNNVANVTIYGGNSGEHWNTASQSSMGCEMISITELGRGRRRLTSRQRKKDSS